MGIKETIASCFLLFAILFFLLYYIIRPLGAIGDIPNEIRRLRESVDKLIEELRRNRR